MTPKELQNWLSEHDDSINAFMDYEVYFEDLRELVETVGLWTQNTNWNADGTTFISLGADGTGSMFLVWLKPGESTGPIAFLGSEGSYGIVANSPHNFAQAIAFAPAVEEDWEGNSTLSESNWKLNEGEQEDIDAGNNALERYKKSAAEKFGKLKDFKSISENGLETQREEFAAWLKNIVPS